LFALRVPLPGSPTVPDVFSTAKILVVDDDRLVLATLVHGLTQAGFHVIDADNGDDAILLAREQRPELALLDIRMAGMSGFDVATYLRDQLRIPFMFLSAFSDEATLAQIRALGALAYLVKPLDIAQIVPAVQAAFVQARERSGAAAPAAAPAAAVLPAALPKADALSQTVPIAVGIVMHRFSLSRAAALERLERLARQEGRSLEGSCAAMVAAVEQLAAPGQF
jgi:two-component system, response regulator PdtaR